LGSAGLRTAPKEDNAISSAELLFGAYISSEELPAQQFLERPREADMPATLIKRKQNFLEYKEIEKGAVAKSFMTTDSSMLIYD
jgi:hypothetical protein